VDRLNKIRSYIHFRSRVSCEKFRILVGLFSFFFFVYFFSLPEQRGLMKLRHER